MDTAKQLERKQLYLKQNLLLGKMLILIILIIIMILSYTIKILMEHTHLLIILLLNLVKEQNMHYILMMKTN